MKGVRDDLSGARPSAMSNWHVGALLIVGGIVVILYGVCFGYLSH
jgi:hypothetical protein